MKVLDVNLLLYATNSDSPQYARANAWLNDTLSGDEPVGLCWIVLLGFLRLVTNHRVFAHPLSTEEALDVVESWLRQPAVVALEPGDEHWTVLRRLLNETGTAGNLTTDAHLAAIALEHGAELCSADSDFARFDHLRWTNPLK